MRNSWEKVLSFLVVSCICIFIVLSITGWVKNIIKLTKCDFERPYKAEIIHGIGLFPPIGAVCGWINIKDGQND